MPSLSVLLFEETTHFGSGPIYRLDQPDSNWLNVSQRALVLQQRSAIRLGAINIPAFPAYQKWAGFNASETETDYFPESRIRRIHDPQRKSDEKIQKMRSPHFSVITVLPGVGRTGTPVPLGRMECLLTSHTRFQVGLVFGRTGTVRP